MRDLHPRRIRPTLHFAAACSVIAAALAASNCGASSSLEALAGAQAGNTGPGAGGSGGAGGGGGGGRGGAGGTGGCPPFSYTDATGAGVTVGGGGAPPVDGGTEPATVCVVGGGGLMGCQVRVAITQTLGVCYALVSIESGPVEMPEGAACWDVVLQPLPCH